MAELIIALDCKQEQEIDALIENLDPKSSILKIGLELFTALGPNFVRKLVARGYRIFLDLKFHDIPNTVARACESAASLGVWMINLHCSGGAAMMSAARKALDSSTGPKPLLIGVTLLTSLSQPELASIGLDIDLEAHVLKLAALAKASGLDGVVCSPWEVPALKAAMGADFLTITPGIRFSAESAADQKRICTVQQALELGSDYLVIGRPITAAENPAQVLQDILNQMA